MLDVLVTYFDVSFSNDNLIKIPAKCTFITDIKCPES